MKALALAVIVVVLGLLASTAGSTSSVVSGKEKPTDPPRLLDYESVFVGTIDSVYDFRYVPSEACGRWSSPLPAGAAIVRVSEVLHGFGIRRTELVLGLTRGIREPAGTRILVSANRGCTFEDLFWATLFRVDSGGSLEGIRSRGQVAGYPKDYYFPRPAVPRVCDLRALDSLYIGVRPGTPLVDATALDLVRVEAADSLASGRTALRLRRIRRLAGPQPGNASKLTVEVSSNGGGNVMPVAGDSLVFPSTNGAPRLGFARRPGDFLVAHGFLSSFDTPFADIQKLMLPRGEGFLLPRSGSFDIETGRTH